MTLRFYLFVLLFSLVQLACVNDDPESGPEVELPGFEDINIITGLDFSDDNGSPIGRWRSPNNKPGEVDCYPNPNIGILGIHSQEKITHFWLIAAECLNDTITSDIYSKAKALEYVPDSLEAYIVQEIPINDFNVNMYLNFSEVLPGFYRLFFKMETGELFWENLYMDPTVNNIPDFQFLDDMCE